MNLVIVESPAKSKTIKKFLGPGFEVLSSYGHVRDLPKSKLGIDVEKDFEPQYLIMTKARPNIKILKQSLKKSKITYIATDPDREGEAIAWHLTKVLDLGDKKPYQRIVFHEITKTAINDAINNPRKIDMNLVDAQQARRVLDRLVGYKLSPFLWKKVMRGLSAGRVQSVAVKLIADREKEIQDFKPEEYWTIEAILNKKDGSEFLAVLSKIDEKSIEKLGIKTKDESEKILNELQEAEYSVLDIKKKESIKNPPPPLTTSTLQQEAWKKFHFPAKFTMQIAQQLYEAGNITYHRTDSLNLSEMALGLAKDFIIKTYGENYWTGSFKKYKAKGNVQEAHEAIRPTYPEKTPEIFKEEPSKNEKYKEAHSKIYELIWKRFIACQMKEARINETSVQIQAKNYTFDSHGQTINFDGFLKIYPMKFEENKLPLLEKNEIVKLKILNPLQHFTQPPARYSEASLVKALETSGVGRPSTYATILDTIQIRGYVTKDEKKSFYPTEIGILVNNILVKNFPEVVDFNFTAKMEEDLDKIAEAKTSFTPVIREFYTPFEKNLEQRYKDVEIIDLTEKTEELCPDCGKNLVIKTSRFGKFYACTGFPDCKYKRGITKSSGVKCPECKEGEILERRTRKGKIFYSCSRWPDCKFALWDKPTGENCPECNFLMAKTKFGKIKCSNKNCKTNPPPKNKKTEESK